MIGTIVSHYRVLREIGRGGMGVVYEADDTLLHRRLALKFLPPHTAGHPESVDRFLREARSAAALSHPNICTIYEIGEHDGGWYIAMEMLEGQTLREHLLQHSPLPIASAVDFSLQIAEGLAAAHAKSIVHRDIKPANIFVTGDRLKILDFGLAKLFDSAQAEPDAETFFRTHADLTGGLVVGTVSYMSPEQARGELLDARTDLFSLGVVAYEMITGQLPFTGKTMPIVFHAILSETPRAPTAVRGDVPAALQAVIARALEKDRTRRYARVVDLAADLLSVKRSLEAGPASSVQVALTSIPEAAASAHLAPASGDRFPWLRDYLERVAALGAQQVEPEEYVWPAVSAQDTATGDNVQTADARVLLKTLVDEDPRAFVLLLGDYGSGKTSFMRMVARDLAAGAMASGVGASIPIYFSLAFARGRSDLIEAIAAYNARYGIAASAGDWTDLLVTRPTVLLLDGFDEMAGWVDYRAIPEIIQKIRGLRLAPTVRLVLSGRSSFFRSDVEVGIVGAQYLLKLRPFDLDSMLTYVGRRAPELLPRAAALFDQNASLRDLCRNPIHLMLFVNWLRVGDSPVRRSALAGDRRTQTVSDAAALSVVDLYQRFVLKTLQDNFGTITDWTLDQRHEFVQRIAWDWLNDRTFEWPAREFSKRIAADLPHLPAEAIDAYTLQLLNCTFFTRVGDRYRFLHGSYVEFLVSESLCSALLTGDLSKWDTSLYTDIFEMTYQLLKARGFENLPVDWIMETGSVRAQANFLATSWRHRPSAMERHLRKQLRQNAHDLVRFLAAMGIGLYAATRDNTECVVSAYDAEKNSVVRAMLQRVASHWLLEAVSPQRDELRGIARDPVELRQMDAERATLQDVTSGTEAERVLLAFRRAMVQGDQLWTAAVGGMLAIAVVRHKSSYPHLHSMATAAQHPEIRAAYSLVQPLTGLPDLPPLEPRGADSSATPT
jgi:hypothetical protein